MRFVKMRKNRFYAESNIDFLLCKEYISKSEKIRLDLYSNRPDVKLPF